MTATRGVVILHPVRPRELTDPALAEALAVDYRRAPVLADLQAVIAVLARAMLDRYEP